VFEYFDPTRCLEPLPLALWRVPWWPSAKRGSFCLPAGATITLYYDCDDINFSEIVVELESGDLQQLVVNPEPTKNQSTPPRETHFVIEGRGELEALDPRVREAHGEAQSPEIWWPRLVEDWHRS
jgi:hypothetical protein